jgi:plastocyanin
MMKKVICVFLITLLVGFFCFPNLVAIAQGGEDKTVAEEEAKTAQEKLKKAMRELKKEIRLEVEVADGGIITGIVKCRRVRTPENVVVYIEEVGDNKYPAPIEHGTIDQLNLTFIPHVIAVQRGTTVDFPNSDLVRHNVFSPPDCCKQFNLGTYDVGVVKSVKFDKSCEVPLLCNVHAEMSAFLVVFDNPYFSVTGRDGVFKIENVPPGNYKLSTWHEKLRTVTKDITVEAGKTISVSFELKKRK